MCEKVKAKVLVTLWHLTLCDPIDCSPPGSSVHVILQTRILEWVAIPFSRGIFSTQGLNPGLQHCRLTLHYLSHQGSPGCLIKTVKYKVQEVLFKHSFSQSSYCFRTLLPKKIIEWHSSGTSGNA